MAIYGLEENGWSTKDPNREQSYRLWASILKHKETFKFSAFVLRKGTKIRFAEEFPTLFSLSLNKDAFVADCWCTVTHS